MIFLSKITPIEDNKILLIYSQVLGAAFQIADVRTW